MSGPVAQWGDMEFNGARRAIKDINASGGIKGDKLVGVEYDDACDPKTSGRGRQQKSSMMAFSTLLATSVPPSTQPASDIYEDEGILMISPGRPTRNSPSVATSTLCVPQVLTLPGGRPPRNISSNR